MEEELFGFNWLHRALVLSSHKNFSSQTCTMKLIDIWAKLTAYCTSRGKRVKPKSKYEIAQAGYKQEKAEKERLRKVGLDTAMQLLQGVSVQCKVLRLLYVHTWLAVYGPESIWWWNYTIQYYNSYIFYCIQILHGKILKRIGFFFRNESYILPVTGLLLK